MVVCIKGSQQEALWNKVPCAVIPVYTYSSAKINIKSLVFPVYQVSQFYKFNAAVFYNNVLWTKRRKKIYKHPLFLISENVNNPQLWRKYSIFWPRQHDYLETNLRLK